MTVAIEPQPRMTAIDTLTASVGGEVLHAGDDGYEAARHVWNAVIDRRQRGGWLSA